jgi:release factor glutamine methyltransferase
LRLEQVLARARETFDQSQEIEDPALEAEVLLREALQIDRIQLRLESSRPLSGEHEKNFWSLVERRLKGEPLAYILKRREFYGRDFYVDERVLIPRPESELLVEEGLKLLRSCPKPVIADIGTGSGSLAICLAAELPQARVYASDVSGSALEVALINCRRHGVAERVTLLQSDLLEKIPVPCDLMVANLPYVKKTDLARMPSVGFEPGQALDGGAEGLDHFIRFNRQIPGRLKPGGAVLEEVGLDQSRPVAASLRLTFPSAEIKILPDLAGIERVVELKLPKGPD